MIHRTLYKMDNNGKARSWAIEQIGERYRTHTGLVGGQLTIASWRVAEPTNVGRSNQRDCVAQADFEVVAAYKKKLQQGGYSESVEAASFNGSGYTEPMLATTYGKVAKFVYPECNAPYYAQNKLDGMRCIIKFQDHQVRMFTRKGKEIVSCPHVVKDLQPLFDELPDTILDGELYNHDLRDDFQSLMSILRKSKCSSTDLAKSEALAQYHVYDMVSTKSYAERAYDLSWMLQDYAGKSVVFVENFHVPTEFDFNEFHTDSIERGYEGSMLRIEGLGYELGKRSKSLQKRKDFDTHEFLVTGCEEGVGNRSGMVGKLVLQTQYGKEFRANLRGGFSYYRELWAGKDKLPGREATVRFMGWTDDNIPRHGIVIDLHEAKRND